MGGKEGRKSVRLKESKKKWKEDEQEDVEKLFLDINNDTIIDSVYKRNHLPIPILFYVIKEIFFCSSFVLFL